MRRIGLLALGLMIANCQARTTGSSRSRSDGEQATRPISREPDLQEAAASVPGQERDAGVTMKPHDSLTWGNTGHNLSPEELQRLTRMGREGDREALMKLAAYYDLYRIDLAAWARWLETAAKNGNLNAQFLLGEQMLHGEIRGGRKKAILWLRRAADGGQKDARELLESLPQ
jgi:TPR repeat protein